MGTKANNNGLKCHPQLCGAGQSPSVLLDSLGHKFTENRCRGQSSVRKQILGEREIQQTGPGGCAEVGATFQHHPAHEKGCSQPGPLSAASGWHHCHFVPLLLSLLCSCARHCEAPVALYLHHSDCSCQRGQQPEGTEPRTLQDNHTGLVWLTWGIFVKMVFFLALLNNLAFILCQRSTWSVRYPQALQ